MKLNRIFIALLSAFLCTAPQIVMTAAAAEEAFTEDAAKEADDLLSKVGEDGKMTEEEANKLANKLGELKAQNAEEYEKIANKYKDKLDNIRKNNTEFETKLNNKTRAVQQQLDDLGNTIRRVNMGSTIRPDGFKLEEDGVNGFKQLRKNINSSAEDLLNAQEKTMSEIQDQMSKELKGLNSKDLGFSDQEVKAFKDKLKEVKTKKEAMKVYRDFKEDVSARKFLKESGVDPDEMFKKVETFEKLKNLKGNSFEKAFDELSEDNQVLFKGLKSNKDMFEKLGSEDFAKLKKEDMAEFNKYVDGTFEESSVEYRNDLMSKLDNKLGAERSNFFDSRSNLEFSEGKLDTKLSSFGRGAKDMLGKFKDALIDLPLSLFNAVIFMVPNLIQAAIVGAQQKKTEVLQWAQPVTFGGKVYQIPNRCLQLGNVDVLSQGAASYVSGSIPVYVQIPVQSIGTTISADVAKLFDNKISGPSENSVYYGANRYTIDPAFYDMTDIVVSYGSSYNPSGSSRIFGSEFGGQVISLKTGMVTDASGESFNATELSLVEGVSQEAAVPLIPVIAWGNLNVPQASPISQGTLLSIHDTLPAILEKFEAASITSGNLYGKFDTSCLKANGGLDDATCECMIVTGLEELQAGLDLDASGKTSFTEVTTQVSQKNDQTKKDEWGTLNIIGAKSGKALTQLKQGQGDAGSASAAVTIAGQKGLKLGRLSDAGTSSASSSPSSSSVTSGQSSTLKTSNFTGLGAVIPVFGWGSDPKTTQVDTIIGKLDAQKKAVASGVFKGFPYAKSVTGYAADDTVWSAQGCWIYLCATTPFIQVLQKKFPNLNPSVVSSITDYIVFMDGDGNIVPLMVPENIKEQASSKTTIWTKSTFTINPVIKYWTSIVFYNNDYMIEELTDKAATAPVMFEISDTNATPIPYSSLGGLASQAQQQSTSGIIPLFLQGAQGATPAISQTFADMYNQINLHIQALQFKSQQIQMQFNIQSTDVTLQSKYNLSITGSDGSKESIPVYSGAKCFGVSNVDDVLIPLDSQMSPLELPNSKVKFLMSLVTDIIYENVGDDTFTVASANSITKALSGVPQGSNGYFDSPLTLDTTTQQPVKNESGGYDIDSSKQDELNNLGQFLNQSLTITSKATGANKDIISDIQGLRKAWLKAIDNVIELAYTDKDGKEAVIFCNQVNEIFDSYAAQKNCYVYELDPSASIAFTLNDYFVFVASLKPTLESLSSLQKINPSSSQQGYLLSLVTGTLYSPKDGTAVVDDQGNPVRIKIPNSKYFSSSNPLEAKTTADVIYQEFISIYSGLSKNFKTKYSSMVSNYNTTQAIPKGPYSFGKYKVAIRSIDDGLGNYVYFNASSMTKYNVKPKDMYVVLTQSVSGYTPDSYDKSKTQLLMSLITGIAVDQNGTIVSRQSQDALQKFSSIYSSAPFLAENIKRLQAEYAQRQALLEKEAQEEKEALERAAADFQEATYENGKVVLKIDQAAATIIRRLTPAGKGLPAPFAALQQDPVTGNYVHISPTQTQGELIYTFMDSGKIYNYSGGFVMQLSKGHLQAMRDQLGVIVDPKTGKQKLGIPQFQPSLRLSAKDRSVNVGQTGDDMVAVGSADYPDPSLSMMPGYGLYYSRSMETYYVLDSKNNMWMSVDAGHIYNKDGSTIPDSKSVAIFNGKIKDYPLLIEMNSSGYVQGFLPDGSEYVNLSSSNKSMQWLGLSGDFNEYSVVTDATSDQATPTKYKVSYSKQLKRTFTVNSDYSWQQLAFVPIDNNGQLLKDSSSEMSNFMELVYNGSNLEFAIYNGSLYTAKASSKFTYNLTPFNASDLNAKTGLKVSINAQDKNTGNAYAQILDGKNVYKFGYMPKIFDTQEQSANRSEIIKGVVVPAPVAVDVGPYQEVTIELEKTSVKKKMPSASTHVLFGADLPVQGKNIKPKKASVTDIINPVEQTQGVMYETFVYDLKISDSSLGNGILKTSDGRFIYKIPAQTYSYVLQDAYVDLKNGILFDASTGLALGMGLMIEDFTSVLNQCGCVVNSRSVATKDKDGKDLTINPKGLNMLQYRGVLANETTPTTQVAAN